MVKKIKMLQSLYKFFGRESPEAQAKRMINDFIRLFPNKCFICSYYAFGRRECGINKQTPPHICINEQ